MNVRLKVRVAVIEKDSLLRQSFEYIVNSSAKYTLVRTFESADECVANLRIVKPEILLVDPAQIASGDVADLKARHPYLLIMIWTSVKEPSVVFNFLRAGASGYLLKDDTYHSLLASFDELTNGGGPLSSEISRIIVQSYHVNTDTPLTHRETEVLDLLARGKSYKEISQKLSIAKETSRKHISNIYTKLNVGSRADAISVGLNRKLIVKPIQNFANVPTT